MKILFVIPPYRTTDALVSQLYPTPYGPVILGTILQQAGHRVVIKDFLVPEGQTEKISRPDSFRLAGGHNPPYRHYGLPLADCKAWLREHAGKFDAVGLAFQQCNLWETGTELASVIKDVGVPLVVGGAYATTAPQQVQELTGADVLVIGEGENVVTEAFENAVAGETGWLFGTKADLESLPLPDWSLAPPENYPAYGSRVRGVLTISRGCPFDCSFCSVHTIMSRHHRRVSPERIEAELRNLWDMGVRYFCFVDDNLFVTEKAVDELLGAIDNLCATLPGFDKCRFYCEEGMEVRVAAIPGVVERIAAHRFDNIAIGLETVNAKQRMKIRKPYDEEKMVKAIENCKAAGVTAKAFYIIGFPGDTLDSVAADLVEFGKIGLAARPNNLKLYPGTEMTKKFMEEGWVKASYDWRLSSWHTPYSGTLWMPEIRKLKTVLGAIGKAAYDFGVALFMDDFDDIVAHLQEHRYQLTRLPGGWLQLEGNIFRATPLRYMLELLLLREGAIGAESTVDGNKIIACPVGSPKDEVQAAIRRAIHGERVPLEQPAKEQMKLF